MSIRHRGLITTLRASGAVALLGLTLPTASFAAPLGEQIDRGDGIAGTAALADTYAHSPALSEDGRFAAFEYDRASGSKTGQIAPTLVPVLGVYVRDLQLNRTVQLAATGSSDVDSVRITADGTKVSFATSARLIAADTDTTIDLYLADVATKTLTLAVPSTPVSSGEITRDGTALVWNTGSVLKHTLLATGAVTTLATDFGGFYDISGDGRTVAYRSSADDTSASIVFARAGRSSLTVPRGTTPDNVFWVELSPDGKLAALIPWDRRNLRALNVDTGAVTSAAWRTPAYNTATATFNLSNEGWIQVAAGTALATSSPKHIAGEVNLRTRAVRMISPELTWQPGALTANGRFAVAGYGHLFVVPIGATPLPGTVDPPSPFAYLRFDYGCRSTSFLPSQKPYIAVGPIAGLPIPPPTSASIVVRDRATNQITNQFSITSATATYPISPTTGNFRVDATVKLADGRTVTNTYYQDSYARADCYPNGF